MDKEQIFEYCQKHGFHIENAISGRKSHVLFLEKNRRKFILKKILVAEDEDIDLKFDMEISSIENVNKINNNRVRLPEIVDVVQEEHFYVSRRIEGTTLHQEISSFFDNKSLIMDIHQKLFDWLHEFYDFFQKNDDLNFESLMEHGPYTNKMGEILGEKAFNPEMGDLLNKKNLLISKVHGDLTPWNVILDREKQLYMIDWGNSGFDYPAHDVTRFMMQIQKKMIFRKVRRDLIRLFWKSFGYLYGEDMNVFQKILSFQYHYSMKILEQKSSSITFNLVFIKLIRRHLLYLSYKYLLSSINQNFNGDTHFKRVS